MSSPSARGFWCAILLGAIVGCNGATSDSTSGDGDTGADDVLQALSTLSTDDRVAAEAQGICPVSGEPLGSMGTPLKVEVAGQTVFICCEGCRDPLVEDPDTYLAKLKK